MAKIPRINLGDRPSGVPGGGSLSIDAVIAPTTAASNLLDVGTRIASEAEKEYQLRLRAVREQKQAIVNEVAAGRRAGDFEEDLAGQLEGIKTAFWDEPEKAPEQVLEVGRLMADRQIAQAPNTQIGLELAQRTNARINSAMREIHNWASARQTQKAKNDLDAQINQFTSAAERLPNAAALSLHLAAAEQNLGKQLEGVFGAQAGEKLHDARTQAVRAWAFVAGVRDPLAVMRALKEEKGPFAKYLNTSERETARRDTKAAFEGWARARELEAILRGADNNVKLMSVFTEDPGKFAEIAYAQKRSLEEQRKALKAGISVDVKELTGLGIDPVGTSSSELLELVTEQEKFVEALEKAKRRQVIFDAPDDPASVEALLVMQDKALKAKNGKDLGEIVRQQTRLAVAVNSKKISGATATTMFKTLALTLGAAAGNAADVGGMLPDFLNTWGIWRDPLDTGNAELNRQFKGQFSQLSKADQQRIRLNYMSQFNTAQEQGTTIDRKSARRMALRALTLETGQRLPGVD